MKNAKCGIHGHDRITIYQGRIPTPSKKELKRALIQYLNKLKINPIPLPLVELSEFRLPKKGELVYLPYGKIEIIEHNGFCYPSWILEKR
jgi:hypothetical protein